MKKPGKILLITGPAGSGKTTLAQYAQQKYNWAMVSEDDFWVSKGWGAGLRSSEQEKIIQKMVIDQVLTDVQEGKNVALEFILYYPEAPNPLTNYIDAFTSTAITPKVVALKPTLEEVMKRITERGRPSDLDQLESRRNDAKYQIACLEAAYIQNGWVIDSTNMTVEAIYQKAISSWPVTT